MLRPLEYDLHLYLAGPPWFATEGVVDIRLEVSARRLASFILHASGLRVHSAALLLPAQAKSGPSS